MRGEKRFRYEVTHVWGCMVGHHQVHVGAFLIDYDRGEETSWEVENGGKIVGGMSGKLVGVLDHAV